MIRIIVLLGLCFCLFHCSEKNKHTMVPRDQMLAQVNNTILSKDMLQASMPNSVVDSISNEKKTVFVENWIRQSLMVQEAEKALPANVDIESLIRNYKESLLILHLENQIIKAELDSVILKDELNQFYEAHKEQYLLKEGILRCRFAKVSGKKKRIDRFYEFWKKGDIANIRKYVNENAESSWLNDEAWMTLSHLYSFIPEGVFKKARIKRAGVDQRNRGGYEYFLHVVEYKDENEVPPLDFVKNDLERIILLKRKKKLIEDYRENLYEEALENNRIKVYKKNFDVE